MSKWLVLLTLGITTSCFAQERFQSGEFKGFTKSATEHIISRVDEPLTVPSVRGAILFKGKGEPVKDVVFEIRGPGNSERIRSSKSDAAGLFHISRVPEGIYIFKATKDGFQSVVGRVIVSGKADHQNGITIEMPVGV